MRAAAHVRGTGHGDRPTGRRSVACRPPRGSALARIDAIFKLVKERGASDLHLTSGARPMLRLDGEIQAIEYQALAPSLLEELLREMMTADQWSRFEQAREVDFGYEIPGVLRVRCNVFEQRRGIAGAFRMMPAQVLALEQLGLPEVVTRFANLSKGLVVVTGPPGSGKSSTQAAVIDYINRYHRRHVITLEDPIEYVHENKASLISQREVGRNTGSFADGLRAALHQDPNVVLVGEMRDSETIDLAITAAETGQLVFGTLHAASAAECVDRLIDAFGPARQDQVRMTLSESLQGVVAQRLLRRADGAGRVAALEILVATPPVRALIREGKTHQLASVMQTGGRDGMLLLDDDLLHLVQHGIVTPDDAVRYAKRKDVFWRLMDDDHAA